MANNRRGWIEALRLLLEMGEGMGLPEEAEGQPLGSVTRQSPQPAPSDPDGPAPPHPASGKGQFSRIVWLEGELGTAAPAGDPPREPRSSGFTGKPRAKRSLKKKASQSEPRIEWDGAGVGQDAGINLASLVGIEDAYEHTTLLAGERVAVCQRDQVAYHLSTWQFLKTYNRGCCCACGKGDKILLVTLPGVYAAPAVEPVYTPVPLDPGEKVISLTEVHGYIGRAVVIEDYVYDVHRSQKGTFFIKFQPLRQAPRPFDGFKVVIFNDLARNWDRARVDPRSYAGHVVRVRGVIRQHEQWGIEILVNSPRVIQIVSSTGEPADDRQPEI